MKRSIFAIPLALALLAVLVACSPRDVTATSCLDGSRPIYTVPGNPVTRWPSSTLPLANGTAIDARGRTFDDTVPNSSGFYTAVKYHQQAGTRDNLCMVGGTLFGSLDAENTPWETWHRVTGLTVLTTNFQVVGTRFYNQGDMISFGPTATNWKVIGIRTDGPAGTSGYIHDDCIQNDSMNNGLVDDSKLDGCMVFMSSLDQDGTTHGGTNHVEVRNSLVWLRPYHNSYSTPKYGFDQHGGFFKWASNPTTEGVAPKLSVHDSTFRADDPALYGGNINGFLGLPPGTSCNNVTLINTQAWPAKDLASWTSQCTNLTLATTSTWNAKVSAWDAAHPELER